ncbi:MAG: EthD domain-containing protein [Myxococcota bacterium]
MGVDKALLHAVARDAQHDALVDVLGGLAERWRTSVGGSQLTLLRAHTKDAMRGDGNGRPTRCFDATLELRTSGPPLEHDLFAGLASELDAVAWIDLCALQLGAHRSFVACDPTPVRFQYCMRRRHDFSHTAYLERYAAVHSRFGLETRGIEGYAQFHIDSEATAAAAEVAGVPTSRASSVSELHLASVEAFFAEGAHNAKLGATEDEDRFVDRAASVRWISDAVLRLGSLPSASA